MNIARFINGENEVVIGVQEGERVYELTAIDNEIYKDFQSLVRSAKKQNKTPQQMILDHDYKNSPKSYAFQELTLLTPVEAPEVWAAGVTYERSKVSRSQEISDSGKNELTIYDRVYSADRPEIFFKSTPSRTVAPNGYISVRQDSLSVIPEAELAVVIDRNGEILGYTAGNDLGCRDIEAENPLYLPQAKIFRNSCSFGPTIRLAETVEDPYRFEISCKVYRRNEVIFQGNSTTSQLKRTLDELVGYVVKENIIPDGAVLMTGTCIIPDDKFTLESGDKVEIQIPGIGALYNIVE